jgi:hypothetical protein
MCLLQGQAVTMWWIWRRSKHLPPLNVYHNMLKLDFCNSMIAEESYSPNEDSLPCKKEL